MLILFFPSADRLIQAMDEVLLLKVTN